MTICRKTAPSRSRLGLVLCVAGVLQAQVSAPRPGFVRYQDGFIASVFGLPGNFVVRGSRFAEAEAASFSDQGGLLARNGQIVLVKADGSTAGEFDSTEAAPLVSITGDLTTALVWLPGQHVLLSWTGTNFKAAQVEDALAPGVVTSISAFGTTQATLLISQSNGAVSACTVALASGAVSSCDPLPGASGPAFEQAGFIVYKDDQGLEIQDQAGNIRTLAFTAGNLQFQRMSSGWVHIYSASNQQHWALRLTTAECSLSQLPAAHPAGESGQ